MIVFLSPHIDNFGFSASVVGKVLSENQIPVLVVNCFTRTNYAPFGPGLNIEQTTELRKQEERSMLHYYHQNVDIEFMDFDDAILRDNPIHRDTLTEQEKGFIKLISDFIKMKDCSCLYVPLGIGIHVDHVICQKVGVDLSEEMEVRFYEDLPYAFGNAAEVKNTVNLLSKTLGRKPTRTNVSQSDSLQFKSNIIDCYKSQVEPSWRKAIIESFKDHGEAYWKI